MNKLKTIIIVGIISIGLVAVAVANNDVKTAEKNSEKVNLRIREREPPNPVLLHSRVPKTLVGGRFSS